MTPNSRGSLTGLIGGHHRVSAHTYSIPAGSIQRIEDGHYTVYVEAIAKKGIARCQCLRFIFLGTCRHADEAIKCERLFARAYPKQYRAEKKRQMENQARARVSLAEV